MSPAKTRRIAWVSSSIVAHSRLCKVSLVTYTPELGKGSPRRRFSKKLEGISMNLTISRRHFLGTIGATAVAAGGLPELLASVPANDNIHLGMMLQGNSAADLYEKAKK